MDDKPTTAQPPTELILAALPPLVVAFGWLLLLTAPAGFDGMSQVLAGAWIGFAGSLVSLWALVVSIKAVRSGVEPRSVALFALGGNVLVTAQTTILLLLAAAYGLGRLFGG
jgi:hypothetical protein